MPGQAKSKLDGRYDGTPKPSCRKRAVQRYPASSHLCRRDRNPVRGRLCTLDGRISRIKPAPANGPESGTGYAA
ncbi:MAG: hypothetical protein WD750_00910, partial [Gammaproteobacteria bacterium]